MAHRLMLAGYLANAIGAWLLFRNPARSGFLTLAIGTTLQLVGGVLSHGR